MSDNQMYVTDTTIIDVRDNRTMIENGQPFPKEAMNPGTFDTLVAKGEILPYTHENVRKLNPRIALREEVLNISSPVSVKPPVRELIQTEEDVKEEKPVTEGGLKSLVNMPITPKETPKTAPQNVWDFDPEVLEDLETPALQSMMVERCQQYEQQVPQIDDRDDLIDFMSSGL